MYGALGLSVFTAVLINPLDERSFDEGDWVRTAGIVAGSILIGRREAKRQARERGRT
jgi:hypothetical protein